MSTKTLHFVFLRLGYETDDEDEDNENDLLLVKLWVAKLIVPIMKDVTFHHKDCSYRVVRTCETCGSKMCYKEESPCTDC